MTAQSLSLFQRIWLSWVCAFRVLFDREFATRVQGLLGAAQTPDTAPSLRDAAGIGAHEHGATQESSGALRANDGALQLLALLQREGRFVDFIQQDIARFADAEIGAAARLVHEGCARAIAAHARVSAVRSEAEGARLNLPSAAPDVKLVGKVAGSAPFQGVLRHRGWRVESLALPKVIGSPDLRVVAPAELEMS